VNGEPRAIPSQFSLQQLLIDLGLGEKRVAIELNQSVVRRGDWSATNLREGDRVEIVHFVGGGSE